MTSHLKKTIHHFTILLLLLGSFNGYAAYLTFVPQKILQPDGMAINCYASGDEFYNWLHDKDGYTIIQSQFDGFYYYAELKDNMLFPSEYRVGTVNPKDTELIPWANIPVEMMEARRSEFLDNRFPARPALEGFRDPQLRSEFSEINNLVIYIRFSDQNEFARDTMYFYNMFNNTAEGYNSMQNYFREVTYGTLEMPSWFYPKTADATVISYQDIHPRRYYLPYNAVTNPEGYRENQRADREHALLKRACEYVANEVPASLDLDNNGDGYVDNVVFNVRGAPSAWSTLLWPHRWVLYEESAFINGKRVWDFNFQIETELDSRGNGVLCHETYHTLGAPDLYHYGSSSITSVGRWDVMDQNMNPPQSMGAYMKYRYGGWIEEIPEITECGVYTLHPINSPENNCFKIKSPNSSLEYFVLEYRLKTGTFESSVPGSGLLVYRIDTRYDGDGNASGPPDEVYVFRPGGTPTGNGSLSEANLSADEGRTSINDASDPYTFLQNGQLGGLNISNVGYADETISFEVTFEKAPVTGLSSSEVVITEGCAVDFYDQSYCDVDSWEWTFEGGTPSTSSETNPAGIAYQNPGSYDVTLKTSNPFGNNTITLNDFITVSSTALPQVSFQANDTIVCSGEPVMLSDQSSVCPEAWNWEISPAEGVRFLNDTDASSQHPEIIFTESGSYTVKLTVINANGSSSLTKTDYLTVGGLTVPFAEDFEHDALRSQHWTIVNNDNFITWEDFSASGNGGIRAAGIDNFDYFDFLERDQLISPPIDLSNEDKAELYFEHAYALTGDIQEYSDTLNVKISVDCGESWSRLLTLVEDGSGSFVTREPTTGRFLPANAGDWCGSGYGSDCNSIDISPWTGNDNVLIMFEAVRIAGNNLYIDNVKVGQYLSTPDDLSEADDLLKIYPNPTSGFAEINFGKTLVSGTLRLYNFKGQMIRSASISPNADKMQMELDDLPRGLYFLQVLGENFSQSGKLILN